MSELFEIKEHIVEGQHIREYPRATANSQDEVLYLAVKQYIPKSNPNPQPGDVTIIGAHANGFIKVGVPPVASLLCPGRRSNEHDIRSYTSPSGRTCSRSRPSKASASGASGWQTRPGKAKAASSTRTS